MSTYAAEIRDNKTYAGNVVIRLAGKYFAIRQPDSGLVIPYPQSHCVESLVLNPTTVNPKQVSTAISSTSFRLVDKDGMVSRFVKDRAADIIKGDVEIWLGRSNVDMPFSEYKKLPLARLSKVNKPRGQSVYQFVTKDATERMNVPIFAKKVRLNGDIIAGTTIISSKDSIADFPSAGMFRINSEIISYASKNDTTKTFSGCARGEFSTTPEAHDDNEYLTHADTVTANPIDILLQILTSGSGAGDYDLLTDGLAIGQALIDIAGIEAIRDELFPDVTFSLALYEEKSALKFLETEILTPCKLRFSSLNDKISLTVLDRAQFAEEAETLDHDTLIDPPEMDVSDTDIQNQITIEWGYDEQEGKFLNLYQASDQNSIDSYGLSASPLKFQFKGVQEEQFVIDFARALLDRYAQPSPDISVKTQMDKSLLNVGDKPTLVTNRLPNEYGELAFANSLEIVSRAINWQTGEVSMKLAYTSFTGSRLGYIAPSDAVVTVTAQDVIEVAAGRGDFWRAGWKVRLWDSILKAHTADDTNEIASIDGDEITFVDAWVTTLTANHILVFCDYDEAADTQKRYAFAGITGQNFSRLQKVYSIVP
jgi:hypothetical protein